MHWTGLHPSWWVSGPVVKKTSWFKVAPRMDSVTDESKVSSSVLSSSLTNVRGTNCKKLDVQKIVCEISLSIHCSYTPVFPLVLNHLYLTYVTQLPGRQSVSTNLDKMVNLPTKNWLKLATTGTLFSLAAFSCVWKSNLLCSNVQT